MLRTTSIAATIFLGALAVTSVAAPALAEDVHIRVGDLDLNSRQGRAQFEARVDTAAERTCTRSLDVARNRFCVAAFREEAEENLSEQQTALARRQGVSLAVSRH